MNCFTDSEHQQTDHNIQDDTQGQQVEKAESEQAEFEKDHLPALPVKMFQSDQEIDRCWPHCAQ